MAAAEETMDDDGECLYRKQGRGVVAAEEISIAFPEIEQERGLIEFWLELGSYRLSMRALVSLPSFAHTSIFIIYIYVYPPSYRLKNITPIALVRS